MKLTKDKLKKIIQEELQEIVGESQIDEAWYDALGSVAKGVAGDVKGVAGDVKGAVTQYAGDKMAAAKIKSLQADMIRKTKQITTEITVLETALNGLLTRAKSLKMADEVNAINNELLAIKNSAPAQAKQTPDEENKPVLPGGDSSFKQAPVRTYMPSTRRIRGSGPSR